MARRQPWWTATVIALIPAAAMSAEPAAVVGAATSSSSSAASPPADSVAHAPEQVVWLRSGAIIRGQLVEYQPGERIVLQLATGEIRAISWSEVSRASFITTPATAPTPSMSAPAVARPAASSPDLREGVLIRILPAHRTLRLEAKSKLDLGELWLPQCQAPCQRRIPIEDRTFRITGPGLRPSNPFQINSDGRSSKLSVSAGTEQAHAWGLGLLISGTVLGLSSGALYGAGRFEDSDRAVIGGLIGLGLGAAAVIAAVPLLARGRTTVRALP